MKKKIIGALGVLLIGSLCLTTTAIAKIMPDEVQSEHIAEADGISGQYTNSGSGVKTGHIQDGAVTDSKISDVDISKVTGLQGALDTKADQAYVDLAVENPILPINFSEPYTCESADTGAIVLTAGFTTCVCKGTKWASTVDGITSCEWMPPNTVLGEYQNRIWMDRNLGASRVATHSDDSAAFGGFYQWGRGDDGHQLLTSAVTSSISSTDDPGHGDFIIVDPDVSTTRDWRSPQNDDLWQGMSGTNNPCPAGFRVPTYQEFYGEHFLWKTGNYTDAFESPLKLATGGHRTGLGDYEGPEYNNEGFFWTSTVDVSQPTNAVLFKINFHRVQFYTTASRSMGINVRCIMD